MTKTLECGMPQTRLMSYAHSTPEDPIPGYEHIDQHVSRCAVCQNVLAGQADIDQWAQQLRAETQDAPRDENWAKNLIDNITLPFREGAPIEVDSEAGNSLAVSEMLVRRLIRSSCSTSDIWVLKTEVNDDSATKTVESLDVDVAVRYGQRIPELVGNLRKCVADVWQTQTGREVGAVNVAVLDLFGEEINDQP